MTLGEKIKQLRTEKAITQKALDDQMYVSFQTISKWENDENEPDVTALKQLASIFDCSLDYLLGNSENKNNESTTSSDDISNASKEGDTTIIVNQAPQQPVQPQIIIQKAEHVCEYCKKSIPEEELVTQSVRVRSGGRGHRAVYREGYYHKDCLAEYNKEKAAHQKALRKSETSRARRLSWIWSSVAGILALVISMVVMFVNPDVNELVSGNVGFIILYSFIIGYGIFSMIYCILAGSYIADVFLWCSKLSIKFPGLIFRFDLDGIVWVICMKILFWILGIIIGILAFIFAVVFSATLSCISFPFVVIANHRNGYSDSLLYNL